MHFVIMGAGAWGTAFALHLARAGREVTLIPRREAQARDLAARRENIEYLPGQLLPAEIRIAPEGDSSLALADVILLACPAQALRETCARLREAFGPARPSRLLVSLAKGLELGTHLRATEVIASVLPGFRVAALAGPTNALGVARGDPSAMVLASALVDPLVESVQSAISSPTLRVYTTDDLAGVEFGGCLKNIYAIAAGCCDGLKLGDNTKAALLTRALAEMVRVGVALGARTETFYGLSGFGDLVATCYGGWSRNRDFGHRVGQGMTVSDPGTQRRSVVEGYKTTESFAGLCAARDLEAPILREMHAILFEGKRPAAALAALMARDLKRESRVEAVR